MSTAVSDGNEIRKGSEILVGPNPDTPIRSYVVEKVIPGLHGRTYYQVCIGYRGIHNVPVYGYFRDDQVLAIMPPGPRRRWWSM